MPLKIPDADATTIPVDMDTSQIPAGDAVQLAIPYVQQVPGPGQKPYAELCWAACCAMVTQALNRCYPGKCSALPQTICQVASTTLEKPCCPNPDDAGCDVTADVNTVYEKCGLPCTQWSNYFEWDAVEQEIGIGRRPIEVYFLWTKGGSHVALISGYKSSTHELFVLDPLYGAGWTRYEDVLAAYGWGSWTQSYYGIGFSLG
jgi:Papain-like cysteine protease AvrRpt2